MSIFDQARVSARGVLLGAIVFTGSVVLPSMAHAADDYVLRWQDQFLSTTKQANAFLTDGTGTTIQADNPPEVSRNMAIFNTSIFNAVNAFGNRYQMYGAGPGVTPAAGASQDAAAIEAARVSMRQIYPNTTLYPDRVAQIDSVANGMFAELTTRGISTAAINAGRAVGAASANQILTARQNDPMTQIAWPDSNYFGQYRTDLYEAGTNVEASEPQWATQTPWTLSSASQFRRDNIPAFTSQAYADAVNLTKTKGDHARYFAADKDAQTSWEERTAFFWAQKGANVFGKVQGRGTTTPAGEWLGIARNVAAGTSSDLVDNAHTMALVSLAEADAAISAWDMKYAPENNLWRPIHAIRLAALPGDPNYNPDIVRDDTWLPLIPTSNHPEYVSGHSTFSGAAAQILSLIYGPDVTFTLSGDDALYLIPDGTIAQEGTPGAIKESRTYTSFWDAADEAGMSRIYAGIHYMFSNTNGLAAGNDVGNWVFASSLQAVPEPATLGAIGAMIALGTTRRRRA